MPERKDKNVPVQTIRDRRIKAAIWRNPSAKGLFYTVTVTRSYKQGEEWRDSHSFSHDELLVVAKLMYDAHSAIAALLASAKTPAEASPAPSSPRRRTKQ